MNEREPERNAALPDDFKALSSKLQSRRSAESKGSAISERTRLLQEKIFDGSFAQWREQGITVSMWPDANGLRIDAGPAGERGVHSHIPYSELSDDSVTACLDHELVNQKLQQLDLQVRFAEAHKLISKLPDLYAQQDAAFTNAVTDASEVSPGDPTKQALDLLHTKTTEIIECIRNGTDIYLSKAVIGESIAKDADTSSETLSKRIDNLLKIADTLNAGTNELEIDELYYADSSEDSWQRIGSSHQPATFSKGVFETRRKNLQESRRNAEVSKILTTLLEQYKPETLAQEEIRITRAAFNKDLEFIGIWSQHGYRHVLIDPKKHLRSETAQTNFQAIDSISRSDFEAFEGLQLPHKHFRGLTEAVQRYIETDDKATNELSIEKLQNAIEGALSVITTEVQPEVLRKLTQKTETALAALKLKPVDWEPLKDLSFHLQTLLEEYNQVFVGKSAARIIEERLPDPQRDEVMCDETFLAEMPEAIKTKGGFDESLYKAGTTATVVRSGSVTHGIPFALEAKALRALKVTKGPTLLSITGAKFANLAGDAGGGVQALADAEMAVLAKWQANNFMQGTNSGPIAAAKVKAHQELLRSTDEKINPPDLIGIEPAKELYYKENKLLSKETERSTHPMLPIKMIVTPFHAGWSELTEEEKAQWHALTNEEQEAYVTTEYYEHIAVRQAIIRRASEGYPKVMSIINSGGWSVPEAITALKDGFELITLKDQGRLGTLLAHLYEHKADWENMESDTELIDFASKLTELDIPEQFRDDILTVMPTLQKRGLAELMRSMRAARVRVASTQTYATELDNAFSEQSAPQS